MSSGMAEQHRLAITTRGRGALEITDEIAAVVRNATVNAGIAHIFVRHTSCGLAITENADASVRRDLETLMQRWAPDGDPAYRHDLEGDDDIGVSFVLDLSQQRRMEHELLESRQQLRDLAAHAERAMENERKRIAREIHDGLGSLLTAMKMDLSLLRMETAEPTREFRQRLYSMQRILEDAVRTTRHIASELRPAVLNLALLAAVEWLAENFRQRSAIASSIEACGEIPLSDARATALFRIIQESLTNIARHAHASEASINIAQEDGQLRLAIADNGCGFDPTAIGSQSFGLLGISERLEALAGNLVIDSAPGRSTTLHITMPIEEFES